MNNPYEKYKSNNVFTASGEELTLMLYDAAVKFCNQAEIALENKDFKKTNELLLKVQAIIQEFQITLNTKYEIANQLNVMYTYIHQRLVDANIKKDKEILLEAKNLIKSLRDTWKEAMKKAKTGH